MVQRLLVSTRKGLFVARRTALGWNLGPPSFLGTAVTLAVGDPRDGALYAALEHGHFGPKLQRSDDNGRTWTPVGTPTYPKPGRAAIQTDGEGRSVPWSTKLIWSLAIDPMTPGALWCGTVPGGLFHSSDRGATWRLVRSLWDRPERGQWRGGGKDGPGLHSICVDPRNPRTLTVAISCGGLWRSTDHGESWSLVGRGLRAAYVPKAQRLDPNIQDPHRLVQCAAAPDRMWCQHHNGIFVSDDAGLRWREVKRVAPSSFGFAVAVHPQDPRTAWFVPAVKDDCRLPPAARLVVTQTRDGGKTFVRRATGLPRPSYDLVLRHGLDLAADGRTLALGSSTGGLWISENGGGRFETISAHLPPIYGVRFVVPPPRRGGAAARTD